MLYWADIYNIYIYIFNICVHCSFVDPRPWHRSRLFFFHVHVLKVSSFVNWVKQNGRYCITTRSLLPTFGKLYRIHTVTSCDRHDKQKEETAYHYWKSSMSKFISPTWRNLFLSSFVNFNDVTAWYIQVLSD